MDGLTTPAGNRWVRLVLAWASAVMMVVAFQATGCTSVGHVDADAGNGCTTAADCKSPNTCHDATGATCVGGQCSYPPTACNTPPTPTCTDANTYRTYQSTGTCSANTCSYTSTDTACPNCATACLAGCANLTCNDTHGGCRTGACQPGPDGGSASCAYTNLADGTACTLPSSGGDAGVSSDAGDGGAGQGGKCLNGSCVACLTNADCNDNNPCTTDTCNIAGACVYTSAPDGTACDDGNGCTQSDKCASGACVGSNPVVCAAQDQCHSAGTCDPSTGACSNPQLPYGTACNDGDPCTFTDICQVNGTCAGTALSCTNDPGTCGAQRTCNGTATCTVTYPGTSVTCNDNNACTYGDHCNGAGQCVPNGTVTCASTSCQTQTCNGTSSCTVTNKPTSTACGADTCTCTCGCSGSGTLYCNGAGACTNGGYTCNTCGP